MNPLITMVDKLPWEYLHGEEGRNDVIRWKTFCDKDNDVNCGISFGICELPPGSKLEAHHHEQAEVYLVTEGEGEVLWDDTVLSVSPGALLTIPGNLTHGIRNQSGNRVSPFWLFGTGRWSDLEYVMDRHEF